MKETKPFEIKNATYIPNQLFDTRCRFLSNQQRIFLIFLYRRLYGYGETEIELSYSVIFNDFPCIIKNKQKFSDMIKDLETKGLIKIIRGKKKSHRYIIEEKHYQNLVYWSMNHKGENNDKLENIASNGFDISAINLNENTIDTLKYVYQYEYNKIEGLKKCDFLSNRYHEKFAILYGMLEEETDIHFATLIRCYFTGYFDETYPPKIEEIETSFERYEKYKDIVEQVPIDDDKMLSCFLNVYDSYCLYKTKPIENIIENRKHSILYDSLERPHYLYCSKKFNQFCIDNRKSFNEGVIEKIDDVIETIKQYPIIVDFISDKLKDDCLLLEPVIQRMKTPENEIKVVEASKPVIEKNNDDIFYEEDDLDRVLKSF